MRSHPSWMSLTDSVVLEFLSEHDLELPPKPRCVNLNRHGHDIGYSTVQLRLATLETHGLIENTEAGYYQVTVTGERWLADDVAVEELES